MQKFVFVTTMLVALGTAVVAQETRRVYLSGTGPDNAVMWDFQLNSGRNSGQWTKIAVPSNWEQQGFGTYEYGHLKNKVDEVGTYKTRFTADANWAGQTVRIVIGAAMTDTEVLINGQPAGPIHQGGFYTFKYDISGLIQYGQSNELTAIVHKRSANASVEAAEKDADFWTFGGIYRPVYLEILPREFIDWCSIDARMGGAFGVDIHLAGIQQANRVEGQIRDLASQPVGPVFGAAITGQSPKVELKTAVVNPRLWSAETPNRYQVTLRLCHDQTVIHEITQRFGFRTFEVRPQQGLFLNGKRIWLKGANRHCFSADTGRALSEADSRADILLMQDMNMNAIRCSHYPPDEHLLELCDELGMYVLDELTGWQRPPYDTEVGKKLVPELVTRDSYHPSILFWDNGNEGGWNTALDIEFGKYDKQNRPVLHPWESSSGVNTAHYRDYDQHQKLVWGQAIKGNYIPGDIYMPTEFLHGLYDGGHGAGLDDFWRDVPNSPYTGGGFLWALVDECIARTDQGGLLDSAGIGAPDGIVGPRREKEGSFYTIKEIWSPVYIERGRPGRLADDFNGTLKVENRYSFTNLRECRFQWQVAQLAGPDGADKNRTEKEGVCAAPDVDPGDVGELHLNLPEDWRSYDRLSLTALGPDGRTLFTWSWALKGPGDFVKQLKKSSAASEMVETDSAYILKNSRFAATFDKKNGQLLTVQAGSKTIPWANGPVLSYATADYKPNRATGADAVTVTRQQSPDGPALLIRNGFGLEEILWTLLSNGLLKLDYRYRLAEGTYQYCGISFDCQEADMQAMRWLGDGPYHVYQNRLKGTEFGVHSLAYNDIQPGRTFEYPSFKGYFANLNWVEFQTRSGRIRVATDMPGLYFRTYTPIQRVEPIDYGQKSNSKMGCDCPYPSGDISFLHQIPAIGTKFKDPKQLGPQSEPVALDGSFDGRLYFSFE